MSTAGKRKGSGCQNLNLSWDSANRKVSDKKSDFTRIVKFPKFIGFSLIERVSEVMLYIIIIYPQFLSSLTLVPDTEFLNPLNFLGDRSIFCSNVATLIGLLDGGWSPERPSIFRSSEHSAPLPHSLERGEELDIELIIDNIYMM